MSTKKGPITKATAEVAGKADKAIAHGADAYADAKDAAAAKYDVARTKVADTAAAAKEKAVEAHENARVYVKDNPEKSVGIAAVVGVLIGAVIALLITRRR